MAKVFYFVGTDEAGYGPNLGPLVVSATCWRMTFDSGACCGPPKCLDISSDEKPKQPKRRVPSLFDGLDEEAADSAADSQERILSDDKEISFQTERGILELNRRLASFCGIRGFFPVVDSKKLYHSGHGAPLERSFFLALLAIIRNRAIFDPPHPSISGLSPLRDPDPDSNPLSGMTFKKVIDILCVTEDRPGSIGRMSEKRIELQVPGTEKEKIPLWEEGIDFPLPTSIPEENWAEFLTQADRVFNEFHRAGVALLAMKSRRVQPEEFNRLLEDGGLKSDLLAEVTFGLAAQFVEALLQTSSQEEAESAVVLLCDKLGGRNRYSDLLGRFFPEIHFKTSVESRPLSVYRGKLKDRRTLEIRFQAKGESNLPTAMASIASKFLREMSMTAFNAFWEKMIPGIGPTAGYPVDARRFREETETVRLRMGLDDAVFWRNK